MYSVHNMCYVIFRTPCLACFVPENKLGECIIMSSTNHSSLLNMRGTIVVCDIFEYWTVIYALWDALSIIIRQAIGQWMSYSCTGLPITD